MAKVDHGKPEPFRIAVAFANLPVRVYKGMKVLACRVECFEVPAKVIF